MNEEKIRMLEKGGLSLKGVAFMTVFAVLTVSLVRVSALNEIAFRNIEFKNSVEIFFFDVPCAGTYSARISNFCHAGFFATMNGPKPSLGRTGMITSSSLLLRKHFKPRAQQDDHTPSTLPGHRFGIFIFRRPIEEI